MVLFDFLNDNIQFLILIMLTLLFIYYSKNNNSNIYILIYFLSVFNPYFYLWTHYLKNNSIFLRWFTFRKSFVYDYYYLHLRSN